MKKVKVKKTKYGLGGSTKDPLMDYFAIQQQRLSGMPNGIENPNTALTDNNIRLARATQKANDNGWTTALDIFGNLAMQVGGSLMNQGISNGEGADGKGLTGFINKNQGNVNSGLNILAGLSQIGGFHAFGGEVGDNIDWDKLLQMYPGFFIGPTNNGLKQTDFNSLLMNMNKGDTSQFALGGSVPKIPVEVEGEEVGETPDGNVMKFKGPSHENGGIDINLPEGTEMFSKRIKIDGVSIADRKAKREKRTLTLEKLLEGNPTDKFTQNTLSRTKQVNDSEDEFDKNVQEVVKGALSTKQDNQKFDLGGSVPRKGYSKNNVFYETPKWMDTISSILNPQPQFDMSKLEEFKKSMPIYDNASLDNGVSDTETTEQIGKRLSTSFVQKESNAVTTNENKKFDFKNILGNMTTGDIVGMLGNYVSTFGPMKNTLENRAGDTPNINAFKDYGKDGLKAVQSEKQYIDDIRDEQLQDLELSRTGAIKRNRNSARGINTQRALDLATDSGINDTKANIYTQFANQMMSIIAQQAQMENQQDQVVMQGEQNRDLADRQDRDNFFTQMAQDIATKGQGLQETGYDINKIKERNVIDNLLKQLSKYGISVDSSGNLTNSKK